MSSKSSGKSSPTGTDSGGSGGKSSLRPMIFPFMFGGHLHHRRHENDKGNSGSLVAPFASLGVLLSLAVFIM